MTKVKFNQAVEKHQQEYPDFRKSTLVLLQNLNI